MQRELSRWSPFQELRSMQQEMDELFKKTFGKFGFGTSGRAEKWEPTADCYSEERGWVVRVDLPGVDPKDVHLSVMEDQLFIKGERKQPEGYKEEETLFQECSYGPFEKTIQLPHAVSEGEIKATYEEGVLYIRLPAVATKARKIEIQTEEPKKEIPKVKAA